MKWLDWLRSPRRIFRRRHCPHVHLQALYGDVVTAVGGWRLQCTDCWTYLEGPLHLAYINRDPSNLVESQPNWTFGKEIGNV